MTDRTQRSGSLTASDHWWMLALAVVPMVVATIWFLNR